MKFMKNKLLMTIIIIIVTMFIVPFIIFNSIDSLSGLGWILIFLFLINPIISIGLGIYNGLEFQKNWFIPLVIFVAFPLLYWIILKEIIFDFFIYSAIYMIINFITMLITFAIVKKNKKN